MSFDDVFQFPQQLWLYVRTQVDDGPSQTVVLEELEQIHHLHNYICEH